MPRRSTALVVRNAAYPDPVSSVTLSGCPLIAALDTGTRTRELETSVVQPGSNKNVADNANATTSALINRLAFIGRIGKADSAAIFVSLPANRNPGFATSEYREKGWGGGAIYARSIFACIRMVAGWGVQFPMK